MCVVNAWGSWWKFPRWVKWPCVGCFFWKLLYTAFYSLSQRILPFGGSVEAFQTVQLYTIYLLESSKNLSALCTCWLPHRLGLTCRPGTCVQFPQEDGGGSGSGPYLNHSFCSLSVPLCPPPPRPSFPFSWKWHKPLFGLPHCTVPPLFLIPGD